MGYEEFIHAKGKDELPTGIDGDLDIAESLYPFQSDITSWALRRGRAAVFADCGMGKTLMQLEWARHIPGRVLILAPLAVAQQTSREGEKFGIPCHYSREDEGHPITVTNYEMLQHFDASAFEGVVLDESSILKSYTGKTRTEIIETFASTPYRLAATATPAPNDYMELGNHAEFFGAMSRIEMLATYFVHDGGETQKWRLKGHAVESFWAWVATWAVMIRKPSDLGYEDGSFELPPIHYHHTVVEGNTPEGYLFPIQARELQDRIKARSSSVAERCASIADEVNGSSEQWILWCNRNDESATLKRLIPGAVEVKGSDSIEHKEKSLRDFSEGNSRVLVTKPSIAGFGMNFQTCRNMAFVGLSDSWEQWYQATRRCWRFGQERDVHVHVVTSQAEGAVVANIQRKENDASKMADEMVRFMDIKKTIRESKGVMTVEKATNETKTGQGWRITHADCVKGVSEMESDSVGFSVFSPPFSSLYTYSNAAEDMGNCSNDAEFHEHFGYLIGEMFRVMMPGRLVAIHCMDLPTSKIREGRIGLKDFPGEIIRTMEAAGYVWCSKVTIWKDPVTAMQRTKAKGLLWKQIKKDSTHSRMGLADYVLAFRKPGENAGPVGHTEEGFPVKMWQKWASPIWSDINPSDTLQYRSAREHKDERHIAPLQLEVIRRCLYLWSNRGDLVLSPFTGIGSEGYVSLQMGREFVGFELKRSYFDQACRNLATAKQQAGELFEVSR